MHFDDASAGVDRDGKYISLSDVMMMQKLHGDVEQISI